IQENEQAHHRFHFYDEQAKIPFQDSMEIHVLEIPKARNNAPSPLTNWLRFFQARKEEEFEMVAQTNPAIAEAWGVIKILSGDERERAIAEAREKGHRDMISYGDSERRAGLREGKLEVARAALQEKLPIETVVKLTGLSPDEVKQLAASLTA
ncbi:MAG: Rpn family recombination-promoting nuclease/putative transposase, partial [Deltaproteobacteria bacterium]|nr:Rpn family recombination-promoting nuclease/putative transposase [Deltaproteobacteria bacterium]